MKDEDPSASPRTLEVPAEILTVLESTFQRQLAESAFADAWPIPELALDVEAPALTDLAVLLPVTAPWKGRMILFGQEDIVRDLAAGFHSLPDEMVDRGISLDFLAELSSLVCRDLFCASEAPVELGEPHELDRAEASILWNSAGRGRVALGCNQGRMLLAILAGTP